MPATDQQDVELGPFRLDLRSRSLSRDGVPVAIGGRAFDLLAALAAMAGKTIGKEALLDQVWASLTVEENNLTVQISALRKALGEGWITTVPGRGYRLTVPSAIAPLAPKVDHLPDGPSIAVMPFVNMSGEPDQEYFSDGVVDDVITELSRDHALFVIARNSSFAYRGRSADVKQVGRELGVRYVVLGSVRRGMTLVRVSVQLIEATTGRHVWAERYDRALEHMFAVQDEIAEAVATAIRLAVGDAERRRMLRKMTGIPSSWEAYQRGLWHLMQNTPEGGEQSRQDFRQACAIDPGFASACSSLAFSYISDAVFHGTLSFFEAGKLAEVEARKAVAIDPSDSDANAALAHAFFNVGDFNAALDYAKRALTLNRNSTWAHTIKGTVLVFSGQYAEGRDEAFMSLRLNPRDPTSPLMACAIMASYYWEHNYGAVIHAARRYIPDYPTYAPFSTIHYRSARATWPEAGGGGRTTGVHDGRAKRIQRHGVQPAHFSASRTAEAPAERPTKGKLAGLTTLKAVWLLRSREVPTMTQPLCTAGSCQVGSQIDLLTKRVSAVRHRGPSAHRCRSQNAKRLNATLSH